MCPNSMNFLSLPLMEITIKIKENYNFCIWVIGKGRRDIFVSPFNFVESLDSGGSRLVSSIDDPNVVLIDFSDTKL